METKIMSIDILARFVLERNTHSLKHWWTLTRFGPYFVDDVVFLLFLIVIYMYLVYLVNQ